MWPTLTGSWASSAAVESLTSKSGIIIIIIIIIIIVIIMIIITLIYRCSS